MRLLVLGGTAFLSYAVADEAVRRGHEVTCACRGESGPIPDGATLLPLDRAEVGAEDRLAGDWDAVVDVARRPTWVQRAVAVLPDTHWVLVSSISVYARHTGDRPLLEPIWTDEDPSSSPEVYGAMKVACERQVRSGAASSTVVRAGLIVGPGDPTGRFTYWPARLAAGGEVLAPGDPGDLAQVIDVRDLAAWLVTCAERRTAGVFDATDRPRPIGELLEEVRTAVAPPGTTLTWLDQATLVARGVQPWAGPRSLPLWLPLPEYAGFLAHDPAPAYDAGLVTRPIGETARDLVAWLAATPDAAVTGLTRAEEAAVLGLGSDPLTRR